MELTTGRDQRVLAAVFTGAIMVLITLYVVLNHQSRPGGRIPIGDYVKGAGRGEPDDTAMFREEVAAMQHRNFIEGGWGRLEHWPNSASEALESYFFWPVDDAGQPLPVLDSTEADATPDVPHLDFDFANGKPFEVITLWRTAHRGQLIDLTRSRFPDFGEPMQTMPPEDYISCNDAMVTGFALLYDLSGYRQARNEYPMVPGEALTYCRQAMVKSWADKVTKRWDIAFMRHQGDLGVGVAFSPKLKADHAVFVALNVSADCMECYAEPQDWDVQIDLPMGLTGWSTYSSWESAKIPLVDPSAIIAEVKKREKK